MTAPIIPSGAGSTQPGLGRKTLPKVSTHAAFPGLVKLPNGNLLHVWRDGPEHTGGSNGIIMGQQFDSSFVPVTNPYVIFDWSLDLRDPSVTVSKDGSRVWLTFFSYTSAATPDDYQSYLATSIDGGRTFSGAASIDSVAARLAITSPVVETSDGGLLAVAYGNRSSSATFDSCYAYRMSPSGVWSLVNTFANGPADGRSYQEPTMIKLKNGAVLTAFRYGASDRIGVSVSQDEGFSFSAPTPKFAGTGRPNLVELATGPLICIYRQGSALPCPALYRISYNRGGTFGPAVQLETAVQEMTYACAVETFPGTAAVVLAKQDSVTTSTIVGFQFMNTNGVA